LPIGNLAYTNYPAPVFRAGLPVTAEGFHDRTRELERLVEAFTSLREGNPRWLAILGPRKIGKTSLVLEASRRAPDGLAVAVLDVMAEAPLDLGVFRVLALRAVDALAAAAAGASFERLAGDAAAYRALLRDAPFYASLPRGLRGDLDELVGTPASPEAVRRWLALPEQLAAVLGRTLVIALDEVQELATLGSRELEPFPVMRAVWQRHQRVAYVISGSAPGMLRELVTARTSPFFQQLELLELGPFEPADAIALLVAGAPRGRPIPRALAARMVEILGGNPFYLQIAGQALTAETPPYDEAALKPVLQDLVFSPTGRLGLYFENEYHRLVGRATTAAATLAALAAGGPQRLTEVARAIGASTASTARYLDRLMDALVRQDDRYAIADALFAAWIRWRSPGGTVVPMTVIGDEAERAVAGHLAASGFDLVYQSRASRGAFDLLAIRGADQVGIQVKRSAPPLRLVKTAWNRMAADAARWGWAWVIAAVEPTGQVHVLDPAKARRGREVRIGADAAIGNVLAWLDARRRRSGRAR
jgi:AAA+ ATPase superfamily predicted ATPase